MKRAMQHIVSGLSLAVALVGLEGCGKALVVEELPSTARTGDLSLDSSSMKLGTRKYAVEEGSIIVSENPADPHGRKISLPLVRIRSSNPHPAEPVFWLAGGPGMSNMDFTPPAALLEDHDVVLVGYRGVDGSTILGSDQIIRAIRGTGDNLLGEESLRSISTAIDSFRAEVKRRGVDLARYGMVDVISDLETARMALGYPRINLLSGSYGTRVALLYGYLHPEAIYRSVMVGVNPPGHFLWSPSRIDKQLKYYGDLSAPDSAGARTRPVARTIRNALRNIPTHWSIFRLDPGKIKVVTFVMLFHKKTASIVFDCFRAAERGDYSGLYMLQLAYNYMLPKMMVWGEFFAKGSADFDSSAPIISQLIDTSSVMGSPLSHLILGSALGHWPVEPIPSELRMVRPSPVQTLMVSGSVDFSTPAENATKELLPSLPNGRQVILKEMGHVDDLMNLQPGAFSRLLVRFYADGTVDDSGFVYDPMNFEPPVNLPLLAKVLYPLVAIASLW